MAEAEKAKPQEKADSPAPSKAADVLAQIRADADGEGSTIPKRENAASESNEPPGDGENVAVTGQTSDKGAAPAEKEGEAAATKPDADPDAEAKEKEAAAAAKSDDADGSDLEAEAASLLRVDPEFLSALPDDVKTKVSEFVSNKEAGVEKLVGKLKEATETATAAFQTPAGKGLIYYASHLANPETRWRAYHELGEMFRLAETAGDIKAGAEFEAPPSKEAALADAGKAQVAASAAGDVPTDADPDSTFGLRDQRDDARFEAAVANAAQRAYQAAEQKFTSEIVELKKEVTGVRTDVQAEKDSRALDAKLDGTAPEIVKLAKQSEDGWKVTLAMVKKAAKSFPAEFEKTPLLALKRAFPDEFAAHKAERVTSVRKPEGHELIPGGAGRAGEQLLDPRTSKAADVYRRIGTAS